MIVQIILRSTIPTFWDTDGLTLLNAVLKCSNVTSITVELEHDIITFKAAMDASLTKAAKSAPLK